MVGYKIISDIMNKSFYIKQFILWGLFSIVVASYSILIRKAKDNQGKMDLTICAIPIVLLGLEGIYLLDAFINFHTNFLQILIDLIGAITLIILFIKNKEKKIALKFLICTLGCIGTVCLFFIILWSF